MGDRNADVNLIIATMPSNEIRDILARLMGGRNADLNLILARMPSNEISIAAPAMPKKIVSRLGE